MLTYEVVDTEDGMIVAGPYASHHVANAVANELNRHWHSPERFVARKYCPVEIGAYDDTSEVAAFVREFACFDGVSLRHPRLN